MVVQTRIAISTSGHRHMQDVTDLVAEIVRKSGVETGTVHVFNVGSTGAIGTIEFEPGLKRDLPEIFDRLMPPGLKQLPGHEQAWHNGNAQFAFAGHDFGPIHYGSFSR